jgi:hypothetical protein
LPVISLADAIAADAIFASHFTLPPLFSFQRAPPPFFRRHAYDAVFDG